MVASLCAREPRRYPTSDLGYVAKVVFGDVNAAAAKEVVESLGSSAQFITCNTASYSDQLNLFATTEQIFGRVDIVLANAATASKSNLFAADADWMKESSTKEIDINLKGVLFTVRIGQAYLRKYGDGDIILTSSIAGWVESAGATIYTATKHGVVGVVRGLYISVARENIRTNTVCPWMTSETKSFVLWNLRSIDTGAGTQMAVAVSAEWKRLGLPLGEPEDIARAMVICATAERGGPNAGHSGASRPFEGKMVWVAGTEACELEDNINQLRP